MDARKTHVKTGPLVLSNEHGFGCESDEIEIEIRIKWTLICGSGATTAPRGICASAPVEVDV